MYYPNHDHPPLILILAEQPDRSFFHILECLDQWQTPYFYFESGDQIVQIDLTNEHEELEMTLHIQTARGLEKLALHHLQACWQHSGTLRFQDKNPNSSPLINLVTAYLAELPRLQSTNFQQIPFLRQAIYAAGCGLSTPPISTSLRPSETTFLDIPDLPAEDILCRLQVFFYGESYYPLMINPIPAEASGFGAVFPLPADTEGRLMMLMEKMDISIGIIDLTVSRDYVFFFRGVQGPDLIDSFILAGYRALPEDIARHLTELADIPSARIRKMYFGPDRGNQARG